VHGRVHALGEKHLSQLFLLREAARREYLWMTDIEAWMGIKLPAIPVPWEVAIMNITDRKKAISSSVDYGMSIQEVNAEDEEVVGNEAQPCKRPRNEPNVSGDFGDKSRYPLIVSVESVREKKWKTTMVGSKVSGVLMDGFVLRGNPQLCALYYDDLIALSEPFDDRTADGWTLENTEDYFLVGVLHFKDWEDEERDATYLFKHAALKIAYNTTIYPFISYFFYLLEQVESKAPSKNLMSWRATCSDCCINDFPYY
jgi:hypothetical protein